MNSPTEQVGCVVVVVVVTVVVVAAVVFSVNRTAKCSFSGPVS